MLEFKFPIVVDPLNFPDVWILIRCKLFVYLHFDVPDFASQCVSSLFSFKGVIPLVFEVFKVTKCVDINLLFHFELDEKVC